jgi:hypothetical protein
VKRALKVLSDREVAPQLGLLKSTLLQLDSTFSEREYGASSFRDFMEKVAQTGAVTLKQAGRSMLVESLEGDGDRGVLIDAGTAAVETLMPHQPTTPVAVHESTATAEGEEEEALPSSPMSLQDGIRAVQQGFAGVTRWPMYVRQAKQVLRTAIDGFDERKYGFASVVDLLRAAGKEGVVRIERDRQGAIRVFPGSNLEKKAVPVSAEEPQDEVAGETSGDMFAAEVVNEPEAVAEPPIMEAETVDADTVESGVVEAATDPYVDTDIYRDADDDAVGNREGAHEATSTTAASAGRGRGRGGPRKPAAKPARPRVAAKTAAPRGRKPARKTPRSS